MIEADANLSRERCSARRATLFEMELSAVRRYNSSQWDEVSTARKINYVVWVLVELLFLLSLLGTMEAEIRKTLPAKYHARTTAGDFLVALSSWVPPLDSGASQIAFFSAFFLGGLVLMLVIDWLIRRRDKRRLSERIRGIEGKELTPEEFLKGRSLLRQNDFTGVYVLFNKTKGTYYVGQGVRVYKRLAQHFMGEGNADVYVDWKYGDKFTIKVIPLVGSGYESLNDLERDTISAYDAYYSGYNKTRGNSR